MTWFYPIDWSATAAFFASFVALGALAWNVWTSERREKRSALTQIANHRVRWVEDFRLNSSRISMLYTRIMASRKAGETPNDIIEAAEEFYDLSSRSELMANDSSDDLHIAYVKALRLLRDYTADEIKPDLDLGRANTAFRTATNDILRAEWTRIKDELRGLVN